jgi:hypothetical protein
MISLSGLPTPIKKLGLFLYGYNDVDVLVSPKNYLTRNPLNLLSDASNVTTIFVL